jgi:hypothetical protein
MTRVWDSPLAGLSWACWLALAACGAPAVERGSTDLDLAGWAGVPELPATPRTATVEAAVAAPIELAGGERFRSLVALSKTTVMRPDGIARTCAAYSLRVGEHGLEEGQLAVACTNSTASSSASSPGDSSPSSPDGSAIAAQIAHVPLDAPRSAHVHAALVGATAGPAPIVSQPSVRIRLETDRRALEAAVAQVRWPAPYEDGNETPRGTPPHDIAELYEAVMYPGRYVAQPH